MCSTDRSRARYASLLLALLFLGLAVPAGAQSGLRLFLDCATHCDRDYLRTEVRLVEWVTDREVADVHVIATDLSTGSGGREVTLQFIGLGRLEGLTDRHEFRTAPDATEDDQRRSFARTLRLGLVRYLMAIEAADGIDLTRTVAIADLPSTPLVDPWHNWIFTISADAELDAESRETGYEVGAQIRANRTTEDWKIRLELGGDIDRTEFTLDDGEEFVATRDGWDTEALVVRSVGGNWSVGALAEAYSYKPDNLDFRMRIAPAVEVDLFPYSEATRRRLIVLYSVGFNRYDYVEETVFDKLEENRLDQKLQVAFASRQPWGMAHLSGTASSFLDDWSQNELSISGGINLRLARGLEFEVDGSYARVRDQIELPKGDATDEEVFLQLRDLATGYRASFNVGLSYTFGSFLNTIVNPRFDDAD